MTATALHPPPRRSAVALEQIRSVGLFTRPGAFIIGGALLVLGVMVVNVALRARALASHHQSGGFLAFQYDPRSTVLFSAVALVYPFFVWANEDPSQRNYHWMMPVDRRAHALWKVFAGWVWVMATLTATLLGIMAIGAISAAITGQPLPDQNFGWWGWLVPYTSVTIAYCLTSAAVVGTRQPIVRVAGIIATYAAVVGGLQWLGYHHASLSAMRIYGGQFGLVSAVFGQIYFVETPSLQRWLGASAIWGTIAAVLLVWMSSRGAEGRNSLWRDRPTSRA